MTLIRKKRHDDELQLGSIEDWPPPGYGCGNPQPERRRMPAGWKPPKDVDYLLVNEDFVVGVRSFRRGKDFIRRNDPLFARLLYESPELVHPVRLDKED